MCLRQEEQEQMEWAIRTAERDAGELSDDEHTAERRHEAAMLRHAAYLLEVWTPSPCEAYAVTHAVHLQACGLAAV